MTRIYDKDFRHQYWLWWATYRTGDKGFLNDKSSKCTSWNSRQERSCKYSSYMVLYDPSKEKIYVMTGKQSKKLENISKNELIYFCIDDPNSPYKGVRGKGSVKTHEDVNFQVHIAQRIPIRYLGTLDNLISHEFVERTKEGQGIVLEISPRYYSTWDHNKQ